MYVCQFGTCGSGPGQLHYPTGLVINNNLLYAVDEDNHCVFTSCGEKGNQFNGPRGITTGKEGYLYFDNNRLVMY